MPSPLADLTHRIGRRGAFLLLFGLGYVLIGLGQILTVSPPTTLEGLTFILRVMPIGHWGYVWIGCGLTAMALAFTRRIQHDVYGFSALALMSMLWASAFFVGGFYLHFPRALLQGAVYTVMAVAVCIVAGWPEPPVKTVKVPEEVVKALMHFEL